MARLFADGFELQNLDLWSSQTGATVVSGASYNMVGYCGEINGTTDWMQKSIPAKSAIYVARKVRFTNQGTNAQGNGIVGFLNGTTVLGHVTVYSYQLRFQWGSTTVAYGTIIQLNQTYLAEVYYLPKSDGTGRCILKWDGVTVIDYTGKTAPTTLDVDGLWFGYRGGYAESYSYIDDVIVDDANWPGATLISAELLKPSGAGANTNQTPSTGSNYACVDEVPHSDTDYCYKNSEALDTYAATDLTFSGVVKAVYLSCRAIKEGATAVPGIQGALKGSAVGLATRQDLTTSYKNHQFIFETIDGGSLTVSNLNSAEIGSKLVA